jgi:hypothetical protein
VGSTGEKWPFAECEPGRALARLAERSIEDDASFEGQCLPLSNANFESGALAVAQLRHGSAKVCPAAISHSTGNNETKATFTRSITTYRFDKPTLTSFISNECARPFICSILP